MECFSIALRNEDFVVCLLQFHNSAKVHELILIIKSECEFHKYEEQRLLYDGCVSHLVNCSKIVKSASAFRKSKSPAN